MKRIKIDADESGLMPFDVCEYYAANLNFIDLFNTR